MPGGDRLPLEHCQREDTKLQCHAAGLDKPSSQFEILPLTAWGEQGGSCLAALKDIPLFRWTPGIATLL
jgi:hypothetical protein